MFKNLTVAKKITIGFAVVLILLSIVSFVSFFALNRSSTGFTTYRELARDTNLAGRLQANMLMVRMNVKDYLISGSDKDLAQYNEYNEQANEFMAEAQKEIQEPKRAKMIDDADENLKGYQNSFQQVVSFQNERNKLVKDVLDEKGPYMEKTLSEIYESAKSENNLGVVSQVSLAMKHLLLGRLYMVKFLETNEQSAIDRVNKEFNNMQEQLDALEKSTQNPQIQKWLLNVAEAKEEYTSAFDKVTHTIFERNKVISGSLDQLGPAIAKDLEDVKLSVIDEQDALGPKLQTSNNRSVVSILVVSLIAFIFGIVISLIITKGILNQLGKDPAIIADIVRKVARGDLTMKFEDDQKGTRGVFADIKEMTERLREILGGVKSSADNVASGTQELSSTSEEMSQGANEQSASVEEISASMEQMVSNIQQSAQNAQQTEKIAAKSAQDAKEGGQAVSETVSAMKDIAGKISIIEEIARQTNLLALNAAIEAARAGEYGKGFAVVASEVRKLAERSQVAAAEISQLSTSSVEVAERAGQMLAKLVPDIQKTSELVQEISSASSEQNSGAGQISKAVQQLEQVVQQNAGASEEVAATSEEMASQAEQLQSIISFFKVEDTEGTIRRKMGAADIKPQHKLNTHVAHLSVQKAKDKSSSSTGLKHLAKAEGTLVHAGGNGHKGVDDLDGEFEIM